MIYGFVICIIKFFMIILMIMKKMIVNFKFFMFFLINFFSCKYICIELMNNIYIVYCIVYV